MWEWSHAPKMRLWPSNGAGRLEKSFKKTSLEASQSLRHISYFTLSFLAFKARQGKQKCSSNTWVYRSVEFLF